MRQLCCFFILFLISQTYCKRSSTSTTSTSTAAPNNCVNSVQSTLDSNICYKVYTENWSYFKAKTECRGLNGHLTSINSTVENKLIQTIALKNVAKATWVWIGGGNFDNNTWEWEDGTPMDYENYGPGAPSLNLGMCLTLRVSNGFWFSIACNETMPFICKLFTNTSPAETSSSIIKLTTKSSPICPDDTIQNLDDPNLCYNISEYSTDFYSAKESCENDNTVLTDIQNSYENTFITIQVNKTNPHTGNYWTGGVFDNDAWIWGNGKPIIFTNWATGQPFVENVRMTCLVVNSVTGLWYTADCDKEELTFVCKYINLPAPTTAINQNMSSSRPSTTTTTTERTTTATEKTNSTLSKTFTTSQATVTTADTTKNSDLKWYIIGGVIIIVITITVLFLIFLRVRKRKQAEIFKNIQENIRVKFELSPLEKQLSHEDRLKLQLDSKNVVIDFNNVLGRGSNATVYEAFIKGESKQHLIQKSFKTPKYQDCKAALKLPTNFDTDEIETFVRELDALISVGSHPHIITFFGWTLYKETPALITEQAQTSLLTHVKSLRDQELPIRSILSILWQVSQALEHIATFSMVHRDVACRNILLIDGNQAKLADFGLCCHCDESFTYRASLQKRFPLKWLPIEALVDRLFSEKSDVWSFGVLCYEKFTYGSVPYPALTNVEMLEFLQAGNRLEKPPAAPDAIYDLMLSCWKADPGERPSFNSIGAALRSMLEIETASYGYLNLDVKCSVS